MAAHRVQKFGKATKAAQLLEIRQAAPAEHQPGLSQHKGGGVSRLCSNTASCTLAFQSPSCQRAAKIHLQSSL